MSGERPSIYSYAKKILDFRGLLAEKDAALKDAHGTISEQRQQISELTRLASMRQRPEEEFPKNCFFVIGRARSGTTWLRSLLNAHPEILCWGEGRVFERSFERPEYAALEGMHIPPTSLYGALERAEYLRDWISNSVWSGGESYEEHLKALTRLCVRHFMEGRLEGTGARFVGDKTPYRSSEVVGEIASVLPGAKVIHIVRDGRDAAVSFVHHSWNYPTSEGGVYDLTPEEFSIRDAYRSGTLEGSLFTRDRLATLAREWAKETTGASEAGRKLPEGDYLEVRYEDLLEAPPDVTKKLLDFLGADSGEDHVKSCLEKTAFQTGAEGRKPGEEDSSSRFRKGIKGDWKNVFTPEDLRTFDEISGEALDRFGYDRGA